MNGFLSRKARKQHQQLTSWGSFQNTTFITAVANPAILIIDEASNLFQNKLSSQFRGALRDLKDDWVNFCLHAVALVGIESIKEVLVICTSTKKISLFSVETTIPTSRFALSEVMDLLTRALLVSADTSTDINAQH